MDFEEQRQEEHAVRQILSKDSGETLRRRPDIVPPLSTRSERDINERSHEYNTNKNVEKRGRQHGCQLSLKALIVLIFLNLLTQVTFVKRVIYTHKNIVFKDPVGLIVDGLVSKRYGLIFPINYHRIILRRSNYESNFGVSRTVSKSTKHGYTSLILPTKPFKTDLTICIDISSIYA